MSQEFTINIKNTFEYDSMQENNFVANIYSESISLSDLKLYTIWAQNLKYYYLRF